ncbi:holin family protein [Ruminiclostridium hungatei]|uniref:Holin family protein n=1 Tax=Ruminiclostridium hungatei TaxID=48256 RepID=A0A1V4SRI1_RUMHU|nr:phage holin family protein [Ruminiclostridium hungatei]OPX46393.1 holin family protein [Ruminiclostridium hungatei]
MYELFNKVFDTVKPAVALLWAGITYLIFPEQSFVAWCIALWVAVILDLLTRWFAIFSKSGGITRALKTKAWNSETMFNKTAIKIVAYLVIQILAGLSMRFISIPYISNVVATVVYAFLFFREFASNIENLIDAGADYLKPLLFWVKKKESAVLEQKQQPEVNNNERI